MRAGRTVLDAPLQRLGCPRLRHDPPGRRRRPRPRRRRAGGAARPVHRRSALLLRPCSLLRYDPAARVPPDLRDFGNYGYELADLDHDGLPEFSAFDERFVYDVHGVRLLVGAAADLAVPAGAARRRDAAVPGADPDAARRWSARLPEIEAPRRTSTSARTSPPTSPTSTCSAGPPRRSGRSTTRSTHGVLYRGKKFLGRPPARPSSPS